MPQNGTTSGAYAWYVLGLLTVVSVLNYLDRTLTYILFAPIKSEMSFSEFELGVGGELCPARSFVDLDRASAAVLLWRGSKTLDRINRIFQDGQEKN